MNNVPHISKIYITFKSDRIDYFLFSRSTLTGYTPIYLYGIVLCVTLLINWFIDSP